MPHPTHKADHDHILRSAADLLACWLLLAAGCSREQQDWRSAEAADTSEAYTHFLEQHADSELATQARTRIRSCGGERLAPRDGTATIEAYRGFWRSTRAESGPRKRASASRVSRSARPRVHAPQARMPGEPQRRARAAARHRRGGRRRQLTAGIRARDGGGHRGGCRARSADLAQPAPASEENAVASALKTSNGYGVQFGAFGSQASADREWQRLQGRFGSQLSGLAPRIVVASTTMRSALSPAGSGRRGSAGACPVRCPEGAVAGLRPRDSPLTSSRPEKGRRFSPTAECCLRLTLLRLAPK